MSAPPLLVGAAVLFWGWETGLGWPALLLAVVLEGSRVVRWRLELSPADFNRAADLCALLLLGSAVYLFALAGAPRALGGPRAITVLLQRLPLLLALLVACQAYSATAKTPAGALFWTLRKKAEREGTVTSAVDLAGPYVVLCLLAASAANVRTPVFYVGLCVLAAWGLWRERSPRFSLLSWTLLLAVAAALGWGGQMALQRLQARLEQAVLEYIFQIVRRRDTDPFRVSTAIGHLGELKVSDRILLRVEPDAGSRPPILLREATYNVYNAETWYAVGAPFTAVQAEADGETWKFTGARRSDALVAVSAYLARGRGVLALPTGAFEIEKLAVVGVSRNPLGAVKVDEGLGLVTYRARFGPPPVLDGPPNAADLAVPARERPALAGSAVELELGTKTPPERVEAVAAYFRRDFRYALYQRGRPVATTPLEDFLLRWKSGHCEYFATATVLLLRAAGVPARYAVGYSAQEWSPLERRWVVRARHAHAWALVWVDGAWRDLDTTPAVWANEEDPASLFRPLADLWSWGEFLFSRWRYGEGESALGSYLGWLLVPLVLLLGWRLHRRRRVRGAGTDAPGAAPRPAWPGADSEFYLVERELARRGLGRGPSEPASAWVRRLADVGAPPATAPLPAILALHYRYRFDPEGLGAEERNALRARVEAWLAARAAEPPGTH